MSELNGKIVLVTGANRGIGRALADRFLAAGARCILTVRSDDAARTLAHALGAAGERAVVERCDLACQDQVAGLRGRVGTRFERIDVLVNNAGFFASADRAMPPDDLDLGVLRETLEINVVGTIAMCTAFASMIPRGGRIINLSSTMGQFGADGLPGYATAYSISKTAINAYTSALANRLAERGILVDCMHPGWVKTEMGGRGAKITPEESTDTAFFLATRSAGPTGKFWLERRVIDW